MGTKLFVGNLSYSITEQQLREVFEQSGRTVQSVRIALDRETQRPRGFAFVEVATEADAESAIRDLNGNPLAGRNVFVEKAQERAPGAPRPPRPPRPMGNHGGGGPGGGGPGGPPRSFGGPPRSFTAMPEPQREEQRRRQARPERRQDQKRRGGGRPKEEERERGKWRWDGNDDY